MISNGYIEADELRRIGPPVHEGAVGRTLVEWLGAKYLFYSPGQWRAEILGGRITVNQTVIRDPEFHLSLNDRLARVHPISEEPFVNTHLDILFQDGDIAVVAKPAGLPMHEAAFFRRNTVRWLLPKFLGDDWCAVHRLDRETSGVLLCARGRQMREALGRLWTENSIAKTYLAVVDGLATKAEWLENLPIAPARSPHEFARCVSKEDPRGQAAVTQFRVVQKSVRRSLIEAVPWTGRTHQIRVHLAQHGLPIIGDKIYGSNPDVFSAYKMYGNTPEVQKLAGYSHHLLHASQIGFHHPLTGTLISVQCPAPTCFQEQLGYSQA